MRKIITTIALSITGLAAGIITMHCAYAQTQHSTNIYGTLGLNTIPNARMDETGTIRTQISQLDPYLHGFIGIQIADPLYIGLRQSAEFSSFSNDAKHLYPGIDAKLRLNKESAHTPEIAFGVQSGLGHKRQSGEYLALSKRYKDLDVTGGIGWGRFASAAHIDNPLNAISSHFGKDRPLDGETPTKPQNWLTGQDIGFFAGAEYFTPIKGLSLKADYGGDAYEAEKNAFNFRPAAPWSIGFNYKPWNFLDFGLAAQGTEKIMARLSLQGNIKNWRHQSAKSKSNTPLAPYRTDTETTTLISRDAERDHLHLKNVTADYNIASATIQYNNHNSAPNQLGKALIHMANNAGQYIEALKLSPVVNTLRGPSITFMRRSIESAFAHNNGSTDEIWHTTAFKHDFSGLQKYRINDYNDYDFKGINVTLDNQISLSEEDTSLLRRTSLIVETTGPHHFKYFTSGLGLRLNLSDNIGKLKRTRARRATPIKSDVYDFADRFFAIDTAYIALPHTIMPNLHSNLTMGYLDENFAGLGGEILYRPFDKRYAIGAESWLVKKRDPYTVANLGTRDTSLFSGSLNGWYDIPKADVVFGIKAGRLLAQDVGATATLTKNFKSGATLEAYTSISNQADADLFGGTTHTDHGLRLNIPLGGYKYLKNANIRVTAAPFGKDIAQSVDNPLPLYKATNQFSLSHLAKHWDELNE
ncbi:MAG: YjbH domain-containing protein [Alphaproteobacteria bacterium]|nr:YjbH domain-containing protein [Alphaproteobacteria bacterium]